VQAPDIQTWGDYPGYTAVLHQAIIGCNADKAAVNMLLKNNDLSNNSYSGELE
jgi:hypothetical protein